MRLLAIILLFITSLYSREVNCTDMFAFIFDKNSTDEKTAKCIEYYIDELGCDVNIAFKSDKLRYEPNLLEIAFLMRKFKTFNDLLDKGTKPNARLAFSIGTDFLFFFRDSGVGFESKTPSKELLEFTKTQKYKEFKEEKFKLIKRLLEHGQNPKDYDVLGEILTLINDEKELEDLLAQRGATL